MAAVTKGTVLLVANMGGLHRAPNRVGHGQQDLEIDMCRVGLVRHELQANPNSAHLLALRRPGQFVGYVSEESPVEGAWFEEEKSSCSMS